MRKSKDPIISVIVPVYNNEEFIGKCLDSILAQTFQDFELLVVDDGSTDETPEILEVFQKQDQRVKIIKQENSGVSAARNNALDKAVGEYIMFVDADDYIEPKTLEDSYAYVIKHNADVCVFNHQSILDKKGPNNICVHQDILIFNDYFEKAPKEFFSKISTVWGKLFKNNDLLPRFDESLVKIEDGAFLWEYYLKNPKIAILNCVYYNHVHHQGSAVTDPSLAENFEIQRSLNYVKNLPNFQKAPLQTQAYIIDRFVLSIVREINRIYKNNRWPKSYRKAIGKFLIENYSTEIETLDAYKVLRNLYLKQVFPLISKIYQTKYKNGFKITKIFGIPFKRRMTLKKVYHTYIKKLQKNQPKYKQDTYLLADCLDGDISECNNAYPLFLKMREKGLKAYYVLLMQNPLYNQLAKEDKLENVIVLPNNVYKICFYDFVYDILLKTKAIIVSHTLFFEKSSFLVDNPYFKYIYIQHGQTYLKEHILGNGYLDHEKYNYAVIPSEFESKVFKKYGWREEQFIKTPLPRWDLLPQKSAKNKKILIMFTWRHMKKENFDNSIYKKRVLDLLNNKEFDEYLKQNKIELYFALHHSLLGYRQVDFQTGYKNVVPVDKISEYIKECSLLITDFSSVAFDFMFQNKPVLFYLIDHDDANMDLWDRIDLESMEYKKYFVNNVFKSWDETFAKLKYYVGHNYELERETEKKYDKFFYFKNNIQEKLIEEIEKVCSEDFKKD